MAMANGEDRRAVMALYLGEPTIPKTDKDGNAKTDDDGNPIVGWGPRRDRKVAGHAGAKARMAHDNDLAPIAAAFTEAATVASDDDRPFLQECADLLKSAAEACDQAATLAHDFRGQGPTYAELPQTERARDRVWDLPGIGTAKPGSRVTLTPEGLAIVDSLRAAVAPDSVGDAQATIVHAYTPKDKKTGKAGKGEPMFDLDIGGFTGGFGRSRMVELVESVEDPA